MLVCDFIQCEFRSIDLSFRVNCPTCQIKQPSSIAKHQRKLAWLCGSNTVNVNPERPLNLDLEKITANIGMHHRVFLKTPLVIVFDYDGHEISLFRKGRMLIKNVKDEVEGQRIFQLVDNMIGVS